MTAAEDTKERILSAAEQLVMERGFSATTVDAILEVAGASKGAFFHHFASKADLGRAMVERYARADGELLVRLMEVAESRTRDPAGQLIEFLSVFEDGIEDMSLAQPGCLFVSFIYEQFPGQDETRALILDDVLFWRERILAKLKLATRERPPALPVDLDSLADQVFTTLEGGFILARATGDPLKLRDQLRHLRAYLTLLLRPGGPVAAETTAQRALGHEVEVRRARPDELAAAIEVERRASVRFADVEGLEHWVGDTSDPADVQAALERGLVWVAIVDDEVVGWCCADVADDSLFVDQIDVLPELGRRGIGRRLLDAVEVEAAARGLDALTLVTDAHVPWNRAWYEGLRFRVIGPADRGPGVAAKLARESERGLDPRRRVSMRREL